MMGSATAHKNIMNCMLSFHPRAGRPVKVSTCGGICSDIPDTLDTCKRHSGMGWDGMDFFSPPIFVSVVCPTGPYPPLRLAKQPHIGGGGLLMGWYV